MGGIVKSLFGGSDSKQQSAQSSTSDSSSQSNSGNQAYNYLKDSMGGNVTTGNNAFQQIASMLGVGGDPTSGQTALNNYFTSSGGQFMLDQGSKAITGNKAASGLLNSGSTLKGLQDFGQKTGSQYFNNYLGQLGSLFSGGQQSAGLISGAGNFANSSSTSHSTSTGQSSGNSNQQNGIIPGLFG